MPLSIYPCISIHRTDVSKMILGSFTHLENYDIGEYRSPESDEDEEREPSSMTADLYAAVTFCKFRKGQAAAYYFIFIDCSGRLFSFLDLDEALDCINRLKEKGAQKCFDDILAECRGEAEAEVAA